MPHRLILHVQITDGSDWAGRRAALRGFPQDVDEIELVEIDARYGVLMLTAADVATVDRIAAEWIPRWIDAHGLAITQPSWQGETIFRSEPDAELARVDALGDDARTELFVAGVVATKTVWGLYGKTWARSSAAGDVEALPLWPSRALAARCIDGAWAGFVPRAIELAPFLEQWLTGMHEDGIVAVLVPTPNGAGAIVAADRLSSALRAPTR